MASGLRSRPGEAGRSNSAALEMAGLLAGALAGGTAAVFLATHYLRISAMPDSISTLLWYGVRVGGISAYLVLWLTTVAGICVSAHVDNRWLPAGAIFFVHQLGDLALSLAGLHALLLLGDRFAGFTPASLAVPFKASYRPEWTGLGILALYLLAAVQWSIHVRPRLGYRVWRGIHYASFAVFGLALAHGIASGTDSSSSPMRLMYVLTGATVFALVSWHYLRRPSPEAAKR